MNESRAIRLCLKHHDPVGFEFLVKKYRREAYFHALSLLGNQEDAAEACQESFTRAFVAIQRFSHLDAFYPWFYRILRNCCLNMLGRKKTAENYARQYVRQTVQEARPEKSTDNPAFLLEKKEEQLLVWRTLERLKPEQREILIMKYLQGLSYHELSNLLNIPRGTVMSRLYHARRAFRDSFPGQARE